MMCGRGGIAALIAMMFVIQVLVIPQSFPESISEADVGERVQSLELENGSGSQLAGQPLSVNGHSWTVRPESNLDNWLSIALVNASNATAVGIDVAPDGTAHICTVDDTVVTYHQILVNGSVDSDVIGILNSSNPSDDCAIQYTGYDRVRVAFYDEANLVYARRTVIGTIYSQPVWNNRIIAEGIAGGPLTMVMDSDDRANIVFRDVNDSLRYINSTSTFWIDRVIDQGPVDDDIELIIQSDDSPLIFYRHITQGLLSVSYDNQQLIRKNIASSGNLSGGLGMGIDADGVAQVGFSFKDNGSNYLNVLRSLSGKVAGKIPSEPVAIIEAMADADTSPTSGIAVGDINGDGMDDIAIGDGDGPGQVRIHLGTEAGVNPSAIMVNNTGQNLGFGSAVLLVDVNGDGLDDLIISAPGNDTIAGMVECRLATSSGISDTVSWNYSGQAGQLMGSSLVDLGDVDQDGDDDFAIMAANISGGEDELGQLTIISGGSDSLSIYGQISQSGLGLFFGRAFASEGDLNGDGYPDLAVSNTGTIDDPNSYSSVEVFHGGVNGLTLSPQKIYQSNKQARLFGYDIQFVGDLDGDGDDELLFSEIFNGSGGRLWMFYGAADGLGDEPNWTLDGVGNQRIGYRVAPAGDIDQDGYDDFFVVSLHYNNRGELHLYMGSENGPTNKVYLIKTGSSQSRLADVIISGLDLDGDGLMDLLLTQKNTTSDSIELLVLSEIEWESFDIEFSEEISNLELETSVDGRTVIMFEVGGVLQLMEHIMDGSAEGRWTQMALSNTLANASVSYAFSLSPTGVANVILVSEQGQSFTHMRPTSYVALEHSLRSNSGFGANLASTVDSQANQQIVHQSTPGNTLWFEQEQNGIWATSEQIGSITPNLDRALQLHIDSQNISRVVYHDITTGELAIASRGGSWSFQQIALESTLTSFSSTITTDDRVLIAGVINLAGTDMLRIWQWDGNQVNFTDISEVNTSAQYKIAQVDETTLAIAGLDEERIIILESNLSAVDWSEVFNQSMGVVDEQISYLLLDEDTIIVQGNSSASGILLRTEGQWNRSLRALPIGNNPSLLRVGNTLHITTSDPLLGHLVWTITTILEEVLHPYDMLSVEASAEVPILLGLNDSLAMAWYDSANQDLELLRFLPDTDGDLIPDTHDAMPLMSGQWSDQDGDGFGDNDLGPLADNCPNTAGTSYYISRGCLDSDYDGYSDLEDQCIDVLGLSWWGKIGCFDLDQDGWADNGVFYSEGDKYPTNWKQSLDFDGDGFGDNHGPDCCDTLDDNLAPPDLFPYNRHQWVDVDGDGYGDNYSHFESGDQCIWVVGTSWRDRNGCLDSDGDGTSDSSNFGDKNEWNISHGADVWINDSTQWADSDGDGFGDNSSDNATNPDKFPTIKAAANDSDNDGFPDNWTALWNGSNHGNLIRDYCPNTAGTSLYPAGGCVDRDGDDWADTDDSFPDDESQWNDSDGDGFGDNQAGANYDWCVDVPGVENGTYGPGCPIISADDSDGDGVFNALDLCPDTEIGSSVDPNGCSTSQKDDDQDGVFNAVDICPSTEYDTAVDPQGCSVAQSEADADGDGIVDIDDLCNNTLSSEYDDIDADGCGISQRDSDDDGVKDDADNCPDTQAGYPVDLSGCVDELALEQDLDGDGYSGVYSFDGVNHIGDAFPLDFTQWWDSDGDGYGDNQSGNYSDSCLTEVGNSTMEGVYGCIDDGDGYADYLEPESLRGDKSQWNDSDFDTYGDNLDGNNPDLCPNTDYKFKEFVDENGCAKYQLDSDDDGIGDDKDNCPNTELDVEVYPNGCPLPIDESSISAGNLIMGFSPLTFSLMAIGGAIGSLLLIMILLRVLRSSDVEDWDGEDDYYDEDEGEGEDDVWASLAKSKEKSTPPKSSPVARELDPKGPARGPSAAGPPRGPQQAPPRGPQQAPPRGPQQAPPRGPQQAPPRGPQQAPPRGPQQAPSRGPQQAPSRGPQQAPQRSAATVSPQRKPNAQQGGNESPPQMKTTRKTSVKERVTAVKSGSNVRKTKAVELFRDDKKAEMEAAVEWAIIALSDGESERMIMMSLQEIGWSPPQSRAIYEQANG
jgi:hypothetical protein